MNRDSLVKEVCSILNTTEEKAIKYIDVLGEKYNLEAINNTEELINIMRLNHQRLRRELLMIFGSALLLFSITVYFVYSFFNNFESLFNNVFH